MSGAPLDVGDVQVRGAGTAIAELLAATEKHAKLRLMEAQLPDRIAAAEDELAAAYERLGIPMPGTRRPARASGGRRAGRPAADARAAGTASGGPFVPEPGSLAETIWDLLPATVAGLIEITGRGGKEVGGVAGMLRWGRIVKDESTTPPTFHRAGQEPGRNGGEPADPDRLRSALTGAAGHDPGEPL